MNETQGLEVIAYSVTDAALAEMKQKYAGLKITDHAGYETVRLAIADCRGKRSDVEARRKELKAAALDYGRRVDGEAKRITAALMEVEEPLKAEKQRVDDEKARVKREKEEAEEARKAAILAKIFDIQKRINSLFGLTATQLKEKFLEAFEIEITEEEYQEFTQEARNNKDNVLTVLKDAMLEREAWEKEEAKQKAEAERLEEQRKKQEEAQRRLDEEKAKLEAEKWAQALKEREAEIERQAKERAEKELKEKLDREEKERKEKEEAEAREKERKAAQAPDKEKILAWIRAVLAVQLPTLQAKEAILIFTESTQAIARQLAHLQMQTEKEL